MAPIADMTSGAAPSTDAQTIQGSSSGSHNSFGLTSNGSAAPLKAPGGLADRITDVQMLSHYLSGCRTKTRFYMMQLNEHIDARYMTMLLIASL